MRMTTLTTTTAGQSTTTPCSLPTPVGLPVGHQERHLREREDEDEIEEQLEGGYRITLARRPHAEHPRKASSIVVLARHGKNTSR